MHYMKKQLLARTLCTTLALGSLLASTLAAHAESVVNIYTARHYDSDKALYAAFTKDTRIRVNIIAAEGASLLERLKAEGKDSPADLYVTVDAGNLWRAKQEGVFQSVTSPVLTQRIPAQFRDPDGQWFGLAKRGRVIIYNVKDGKPEGLNRYEDLASPAFKGQVCVRSSSNVYNQSLLASVIAADGKDAALNWVKGLVANFARTPQANDEAQIKAVADGVCRLAIVNTYYVGKMRETRDPKEAAQGQRVAILFPNQADRGTHMNISGAGVTAHAPNRDNAVRLLEFLAGDAAQEAFAHGNDEYPVVAGLKPPAGLKDEPAFKEDALPAATFGKLNPEAVMVADEGGWQ
jgi:iron(III) transport system substrate-binding protein